MRIRRVVKTKTGLKMAGDMADVLCRGPVFFDPQTMTVVPGRPVPENVLQMLTRLVNIMAQSMDTQALAYVLGLPAEDVILHPEDVAEDLRQEGELDMTATGYGSPY